MAFVFQDDGVFTLHLFAGLVCVLWVHLFVLLLSGFWISVVLTKIYKEMRGYFQGE